MELTFSRPSSSWLRPKKNMFVCPPVEKLKFWVGRSISFFFFFFFNTFTLIFVHSVSLTFCHGPFGPLATKTLSSWYLSSTLYSANTLAKFVVNASVATRLNTTVPLQFTFAVIQTAYELAILTHGDIQCSGSRNPTNPEVWSAWGYKTACSWRSSSAE